MALWQWGHHPAASNRASISAAIAVLPPSGPM
jgi:hypothetical protein